MNFVYSKSQVTLGFRRRGIFRKNFPRHPIKRLHVRRMVPETRAEHDGARPGPGAKPDDPDPAPGPASIQVLLRQLVRADDHHRARRGLQQRTRRRRKEHAQKPPRPCEPTTSSWRLGRVGESAHRTVAGDDLVTFTSGTARASRRTLAEQRRSAPPPTCHCCCAADSPASDAWICMSIGVHGDQLGTAGIGLLEAFSMAFCDTPGASRRRRPGRTSSPR